MKTLIRVAVGEKTWEEAQVFECEVVDVSALLDELERRIPGISRNDFVSSVGGVFNTENCLNDYSLRTNERTVSKDKSLKDRRVIYVKATAPRQQAQQAASAAAAEEYLQLPATDNNDAIIQSARQFLGCGYDAETQILLGRVFSQERVSLVVRALEGQYE